MSDKKDFIAVAVVGKPVGLKGWCRLFPHGESLRHIRLPYKFKVGSNHPDEDVELSELRLEGKVLKGLFKGFESRESVDRLKNQDLYITVSDLPSQDENEFYHFELKGMVVVDENSKSIGKVVEVYNYPTVDALEVKRESGYMFLLPMNKTTILSINREKKEVVVSASELEELL